jgi:hypothetical protein
VLMRNDSLVASLTRDASLRDGEGVFRYYHVNCVSPAPNPPLLINESNLSQRQSGGEITGVTA